MRIVQLVDLPVTPYAEVWKLQHEIFDQLLAGEEVDTLILCEHPHVYTLGRVTDTANILFSDAELTRIGAEKFEIERGGDVTYHGPEQLVGYPLLNLTHFQEDLGWYLRSLEETVIRVLASYDVTGFRVDGRTGVWVHGQSGDEKICAIGVKASRWCTMHGFAFNINTDLSYFQYIVPCGIGDKQVTSLSLVLGREVDMHEIKRRYLDAFAKVFMAKVTMSNLETVA
jgi:lipoyl(octanoyl) transferase